MRHGQHDARAESIVTLATLESKDSAKSLLARLDQEEHRAAS
jgi:hypothetical protein